MTKPVVIILCYFFLPSFLFPQAVSLNQEQIDKIEDALTRISMADAIVPNIVYNGMTFNEIQEIFYEQELSIIPQSPYGNSYAKEYGQAYSYQCRVGNYVIFFSHCVLNPVVIGYAKFGDITIYSKEL